MFAFGAAPPTSLAPSNMSLATPAVTTGFGAGNMSLATAAPGAFGGASSEGFGAFGTTGAGAAGGFGSTGAAAAPAFGTGAYCACFSKAFFSPLWIGTSSPHFNSNSGFMRGD
jgi:hypothetical protein